jgi:hypothetical protein
MHSTTSPPFHPTKPPPCPTSHAGQPHLPCCSWRGGLSGGVLQLGMPPKRRHQVHNLQRRHQQVPRLSPLTNGKDFASPCASSMGAIYCPSCPQRAQRYHQAPSSTSNLVDLTSARISIMRKDAASMELDCYIFLSAHHSLFV